MTAKCTFCNDTKIEPGAPGPCVWCEGEAPAAVERHTIANLRYAGGKEHDVRYVSEVHLDAALAREAEVGRLYDSLVNRSNRERDASYKREAALRDSLAKANESARKCIESADRQHLRAVNAGRERDALQQRLTVADQKLDSLGVRVERLRHVGMELTGVIDEYRAMPCDSLQVRMFNTADRYRKRLTAKCGNCEDHGVIGYTTGQTPESFDMGEYPCPECHPTEYAAWSKP